MNNYSFDKYVDMLLVLGECRRNGAAATRLYRQRFPNRQAPDRRTFYNVERRLRNTGVLKSKNPDGGRRRFVRTVEIEEDILEMVEEQPGTSLRKIATHLNISKDVAHRTLKEQNLYPFHYQPVQNLLPGDGLLRVQFSRVMLEIMNNNNFNFCILFTDECYFTRNGVFNFHNEHQWADENPHLIRKDHFQHNISINVWAGIVGNELIGPYRMPRRLNGRHYLEFIMNDLPVLLEDVPLQVRGQMWYMHDGAPPHYCLEVRQQLNQQFPERWIGRGNDATISWPPRSPDINPMDFFFWGALKGDVYREEIHTEDQLWQRILNAANTIRNKPHIFERVRHSFLRRLQACVNSNGNQFEHNLNI